MFKDRTDAGRQLAAKLDNYIDKDVVVFALPRGGLVLGYELSHKLHCPLDFFSIKKIGHPQQEEYAIGAVAENGQTLLNENETSSLPSKWLQQAIAKNLKQAQARRQLYSGDKPLQSPSKKIAIVVDDGIATGTTMLLAIQELRKMGPRELICAVPVLPNSTAKQLQPLVDKLIYLEIPQYFLGAVGSYYLDFDQVDDQTAIEYLKKANS